MCLPGFCSGITGVDQYCEVMLENSQKGQFPRLVEPLKPAKKSAAETALTRHGIPPEDLN